MINPCVLCNIQAAHPRACACIFIKHSVSCYMYIYYLCYNYTLTYPGTVKKCGLLKIIHVKYKDPTSSRQKSPLEVREFRETMATVAEDNRELALHIGKAQEILNPLRVLYIFKSIASEVTSYVDSHNFS